MLTINSLDEFRSKVARKQEIREAEIAPNLISFCYMVSAEGTFDDAWSRECRGIVFDKRTGEVVGRPLHKFFNVNEREETRPENLPSKITRLMDKRDGSMIHTVKVENEGGYTFALKSKKSFDSDVARQATAWINEPENFSFFIFAEKMAMAGHTVIFEYTAPDARIVLPYKKAELQVLHIRNNRTGVYWPVEEVRAAAVIFKVKVVEEFNVEFATLQMLLDAAKTSENIEGWIAQYDNGEMVKVKTDWYLKRHRAMTFLRERDIAQLVLDEGLDDVKSMLVGDGVNIEDILKIENRVVSQLINLHNTVQDALRVDGEMERKDFAIKYKDHTHRGLIMAAFTGKQPSYKEYFERNILRQEYTLRQLALMDSTAEAE
jgi:RNA ligase